MFLTEVELNEHAEGTFYRYYLCPWNEQADKVSKGSSKRILKLQSLWRYDISPDKCLSKLGSQSGDATIKSPLNIPVNCLDQEFKQQFNLGLKAAESPRRDEPRQRSLTQRGYSFTLENKLSSFDRELNALRRTIDDIYAETADRSKLEIALTTLKVVKVGYESTVHDLESLFMQDRWEDFTETADSVRREVKL